MDLCYTVDLVISTVDMRVCVNVIWAKSESREGFLRLVCVQVKCIWYNVKD